MLGFIYNIAVDLLHWNKLVDLSIPTAVISMFYDHEKQNLI